MGCGPTLLPGAFQILVKGKDKAKNCLRIDLDQITTIPSKCAFETAMPFGEKLRGGAK
jgi:hypothetical protein